MAQKHLVDLDEQIAELRSAFKKFMYVAPEMVGELQCTIAKILDKLAHAAGLGAPVDPVIGTSIPIEVRVPIVRGFDETQASVLLPWQRLNAKLIAIGKLETGTIWKGKPDRWYEYPQHWRCENDHVSVSFRMSEADGSACCLACAAPVVLTFPEDKDGPLPDA